MKLAPTLVLVGSLLGAWSDAAQAQFTPEEQKVYQKFQDAQSLNDLREMEKIAQRNGTELVGVYEVLEGQMAFSDSIEGWEEIKTIARVLDEAKGDNTFSIRMNAVMKMSTEQRQKRVDARRRFDGIKAALQTALKQNDKEAMRERSEQMQAVAQEFGELGDAEYQAYSLFEVGQALQQNEQQLDAVKVYDQVDTVLTRAGFQRFKFHGSVKSLRDHLKSQGYDPDAKPGESTGPAGNTGTSWSKDAEGQRYSDPVPLRLVVDEDLPEKFATPSFRSGENTAKWSAFALNGNGPLPFDSRFRPLGQKFEVRRDGVKIFMTIEGQKETEIKVISKPNVVNVEKKGKDFDGNPLTLEYAWLAASGGSQESRFGLSLNASPQPDQFGIRYHPACYLRGKLLDQDVMFFDDNASGVFGDADQLTLATSTVKPGFSYGDAMIVGKAKVAAPFTEYIESNGAFYRLKLDPDEYTVKTRKLDVDVGRVKLKFSKGKEKPDVVIIEETREFKGAYFAINEKTAVNVPVGTYRLSYGIIRKGKKDAEDSCLILPGRTTVFDVKKDEESVLEIGGPFELDFETEPVGSGGVKVIGKSVVVYGSAGELYTHFWDDPVIPDKVSVRIKGGGSSGKPQPMERATFADYQKDGTATFQPLDLVLPGSSDKSYEVKLELKKHDLLGGPISSEWKS